MMHKAVMESIQVPVGQTRPFFEDFSMEDDSELFNNTKQSDWWYLRLPYLIILLLFASIFSIICLQIIIIITNFTKFFQPKQIPF